MPVRINENLPAYEILTSENIFVMSEQRAETQDIRPLRIAILNIMPTKVVTETQLLRLLGNTPLQVDITFLHPSTHLPKNTPREHLESFYRTFDEIKNQKFDGFIITGAPVEQLDFNQVNYWEELCDIMAWARTNVFSTMYICWGAQAGLYYNYGIPKYPTGKKISGVYLHKKCEDNNKLLRGFDDEFYAPHSRYTTVLREDINKHPQLSILAESDEAGVYLIVGRQGREVYVTGHPEYERETLRLEYERDINNGLEIDKPVHYFVDDEPQKGTKVLWRGHANLLFSNWLNYCVYQETPYEIEKIQQAE